MGVRVQISPSALMNDLIKKAIIEYIKELLSDASAQKAFFEDYWPENVEYNDESREYAEDVMGEIFDNVNGYLDGR